MRQQVCARTHHNSRQTEQIICTLKIPLTTFREPRHSTMPVRHLISARSSCESVSPLGQVTVQLRTSDLGLATVQFCHLISAKQTCQAVINLDHIIVQISNLISAKPSCVSVSPTRPRSRATHLISDTQPCKSVTRSRPSNRAKPSPTTVTLSCKSAT